MFFIIFFGEALNFPSFCVLVAFCVFVCCGRMLTLISPAILGHCSRRGQ
jgi:hypothetical protein